ncbi:hypothetical protein, variant [Saprolegnia diclina VS20]|nr:hypothetical protein, variant [Saprolegnia diclina VS20]EQC41753.1 hypothetical protein, variant [Saprolegnia diclina VS20]|eukprot:XP_008604321.1 hypothetical protein, variant [Saprolegnia diclina VS20]
MSDLDVLNTEGVTPLYVAISNTHASCALLLLEHGASANGRTEESPSLLYIACFHGLSDVVCRLVAAGANVHVVVEGDCTPLTALAALDKRIDIAPMVTALVAAGATIGPNPKRVVRWLARNLVRLRLLMPHVLRADDIEPALLDYNVPLLQLYIEMGGNPDVCVDVDDVYVGDTKVHRVRLLCHLLRRGDRDGACFLARYSDVNYIDEYGVMAETSALRAAISNRVDASVLEALLAHASHPPPQYYNGALKVALREGGSVPEDTFNLIASKADMTSEPFLASNGYYFDGECVRRLLRVGADPTMRSAEGYSALFMAAQYNGDGAVQLLAPFATTDMIAERHDGESILDVVLKQQQCRRMLVPLLHAGFPQPHNLPIEALYWHPANVGSHTAAAHHLGLAPYVLRPAYARLELQYMAVLSAVLDDPNWLKAPLPTTNLAPDGLALLRAEVAYLKTQKTSGFTPSTSRGVFFKDDPKIAVLHRALQYQLAPLEAAAQWHDHRLDVVDPAMYGAVYGHTQYSFEPHRGRLGVPTETVWHSDIEYYNLAPVTCFTQQFLPTNVAWDAATGRATLKSYVNNVPPSMCELYETLTASLSFVLPLLHHVESTPHDDQPRIRLSQTASRRLKGTKPPVLPSVKGFEFPRIATWDTDVPSQRQVLCGVQCYRTILPGLPTVTAWQRPTSAINEAIGTTALVLYDARNVTARVEFAQTFAATNTCPRPSDPSTEVLCRKRNVVQSQTTGAVTLSPSRIVFFDCATAYRIVLSPIDASHPGHCKVLSWAFVSKDMDPLLSTAEVYPQQKHWFYDAVQGSRLATLPTVVVDHVLSFFGDFILDDAKAQAIANASKATRCEMLTRLMGDVARASLVEEWQR